MSKIKKYGKFGKKMLVSASTGIVAGMFLMGVSTPHFAEASDFSEYSAPAYPKSSYASGMHTMRRWNSKPRINLLVNQLGLDSQKVQEELKSGKSLKQILQDNGVDTSGLQKAFNNKSNKLKSRMWK